MTRLLYFAYGSNMLTERLTARCTSATPVGPGEARGYAVSYCLGSSDGSAKAGIFKAPGQTAHGVLFLIDSEERHFLDRAEGAPDIYRRIEIEVFSNATGQPADAVTYLPHPDRLANGLHPYAWYRALCAEGARQHNLPESAIDNLRVGPIQPMPPQARGKRAWQGRLLAHEALIQAGLVPPVDDEPLP
nr:gamma-glutamylcyclotransferase family protein [uncultured Sphaerochaeta sp.]